MFREGFGSKWATERFGFRSPDGSSAFAEGGRWAAADEAAPITEGLLAGTLLATAEGWQPVETLRPGDPVVTFDHGLRPLRAVGRGVLRSRMRGLPRAAHLIRLPEGALGNRRALSLLPGQAVLVESDAAEARWGDPFVLIPAQALDGFRNIGRSTPEPELEVIFPEFDRDEIVYAEGGLLVLCARRQPELVTTPEALMAAGHPSGYRQMPPAQGRALLAAAP